MLPKSKWRQFGRPGNKVKGIIVHNTNNQGMTAKMLEKWLKTECRTSQGCHYLVDADEVRKVMPLSWSVYSVGNGLAFGNTDCIAIEICSHPSNRKYMEAEDKAVELIRELMTKHDLKKTDIYFHRDFEPNINCPAQVLKIYGTKQNFLKRI